LKAASNFDNSATFINHLETKGATPQNSRDVFGIVQEVVEKRYGTVGQEKLWLFLKHIRVAWYDFEGNSEAKNNCINILRDADHVRSISNSESDLSLKYYLAESLYWEIRGLTDAKLLNDTTEQVKELRELGVQHPDDNVISKWLELCLDCIDRIPSQT
jgi:hypothetical protein